MKKVRPLVVYGKVRGRKQKYAKDIYCGHCHSILYDFSEEICPSCGAYNDVTNPKEISEKEADKLEQKFVELW